MKASCTICGGRFEQDEPWKRKCLPCWRRGKGIAPAPTQTADPLDMQMIRRLIQLCHPDKHDGSQAAHAATQWLIEQKDRLCS